MIQLYGNRLYQYDLKRQVYLTEDDAKATQVHFAHIGSDEPALIVEPVTHPELNNMVLADIPNILLTSPRDIYVWTWKDDDTISSWLLKVCPRNKPTGYVYEPTEVVTMESLKKWVEEYVKENVKAATSYADLRDKPSIEEVVLEGDHKLEDFGLTSIPIEDISELFKKKD